MPDRSDTGGEALANVTGPHAGAPILTTGAPLGEAPAAVVMLHGRGASARNILELAHPLARPNLAYVAPTASENTWYPYSFMAETERNQPHLDSALALVGAVVGEVEAAGIPRDRIFLLGFSQGACLATEWVFRNAGRYAGLIVFSGGLIGPPGTTWSTDDSMEGTPVFLGCSDIDSHIPALRVEETAEVFRAMGAAVTKRIYPGMGHLVNDDEIAFAQGLLDSVPDA
jgi:phospholipase/carboxylesterase